MANPTLTDLIARVRLNARDNSSVSANNALTDANITGWVNIGMRMVQRRYAPRLVGVSATNTGLSYGAGVSVDTTTAANYARIVELFLVSTAGTIYGVPLVRKDVEEFFALAAAQSSTNLPLGAGTDVTTYPMYWTGWRGATTTAADQGKWTVLIHPAPATSALLAALVELEQADMSIGTDSPDVPAEGCTLIECIASYFAAHNLGRPWADAFMSAYPELKDEVAWKAKDELRNQGPRAKGRA